MRYLFWLWFMPLMLFWGWFGLSYYDINFGLMMFRRELHDLVFQLYGSLLGVEPTAIPVMFLKACIFDTFLIFSIFAFRKRRRIRTWWMSRRRAFDARLAIEDVESGAVQQPAE